MVNTPRLVVNSLGTSNKCKVSRFVGQELVVKNMYNMYNKFGDDYSIFRNNF